MLLPLVAGYDAAEASPPLLLPLLAQGIPLLTHTPCYSATTADEPVNPRTVVLPSVWETTAESLIRLQLLNR